MSKPNHTSQRLAATVAAGYVGLALASAAGAVDLRSWDQKINDVTKRFIVLSTFNKEPVLDKETQLVWQRSALDADSWSNAVIKCQMSFAGARAGWRLPSISELRSLLGSGRYLETAAPFQNIIGEPWFWSSSDPIDDSTKAYITRMSTGQFGSNSKTNTHSSLCVRGAE